MFGWLKRDKEWTEALKPPAEGYFSEAPGEVEEDPALQKLDKIAESIENVVAVAKEGQSTDHITPYRMRKRCLEVKEDRKQKKIAYLVNEMLLKIEKTAKAGEDVAFMTLESGLTDEVKMAAEVLRKKDWSVSLSGSVCMQYRLEVNILKSIVPECEEKTDD